MKTIHCQQQPDVRADYDVLVAGAGPAGICAAVAAAREGARVALVERYGVVGGNLTAGYVGPILGMVGRGTMRDELVRLLGVPDNDMIGITGKAHDIEEAKRVLAEFIAREPIDVYLQSSVYDVMKEDETVRGLILATNEGPLALTARITVDATGDADLALQAGVPMQPAGETLQPASLIFMLGGVDTDALPMLRHSQQGVNYHDLAIRETLERLRETQDVPLFGGPWYCGVLSKGVVLLNMTRTQVDMADNREATAAECLLREHVQLFTELLRKHVPAFRDATLLCTATQTGVRETRRIKGFHTLTGEEYLHAVDFPDAVSRGCHPVDIHAASSTQQRCEFLKEAAFIPYRCLIAPDFPNLLVAGRSFSADAVASASVRVQASVMGLGQAAGAAAALCVRSGVDVSEVNIGELRKTLTEYGANLTA